MEETNNTCKSLDFIREIIADDKLTGKHGGKVKTRFPPEPNGYLHIGHAKAFCIDFGIAEENNSVCNLRFDDTNPVKEDVEYIESIKEDIHWLGFDWGRNLYFASDYFDKLYEYAVQLIKIGKAYVCDLNPDQIREYRGTLTKPGKDSPFRNRSVEENLALFDKMKKGEFSEGHCVLRAKIDMASPNLNMRDPAVYRILKSSHHRTGNKWNIYPMYDFTHCISDAIEGITHSLCSLEFEDHRPLYDWFLDTLKTENHPRQIEFARLELTYTVLSKRKLIELVTKGHVKGWDDPRMPALAGLRRRGYTAKSIRDFISRVGVSKSNSIVDISLLEYYIREELNKKAPRVMVVLNPVKLVIDNYPEGKIEYLDAENNPEDTSTGSHKIPFSRVIYIEDDDFKEVPPKKYFRLSPGNEVRLKFAYYIKCENVVKDKDGKVSEIHCSYDPKSKGGWTEDNRKVPGTLHWVSAEHAVDAEVRIYERLFTKENPNENEEGKSFLDNINPNSLVIHSNCKAEPMLAGVKAGERFQFMRQGYFCVDPDSTKEKPVFNRIVSLKDSWSKIEKKAV